MLTADQRKLRSQIATSVRYGHDDPAVDEARRELKAARIARILRRDLAKGPELTTEQRARLAAIAGGDAA